MMTLTYLLTVKSVTSAAPHKVLAEALSVPSGKYGPGNGIF